jgi:hypothetical protein
MIDVSDTIVAKSDQLNADDLIGGPITIRITDVNKPGGDQPITIKYEGDNGRPFKPCKTVRRILVKAWGKDASAWKGRLMTLYNDPSVKWAGKEVGGLRVSHLSNISSDMEISLTETRGSKKPHKIKKLADTVKPQGAPAQSAPVPQGGPNIRLIKSDGSAVQFDNFQAWLDFMGTNLPKITDLARMQAFGTTHEPIFAELETEFPDWVQKARDLVSANVQRLGGGDAGSL